MEKNTLLQARKTPVGLTIAGSDSGGCAGIQADLRTFSSFGVHGMSAITSVTAQNTRKVRGVSHISPSFVGLQIEAVLDDIGADAVKTGMLPTSDIISEVARQLSRYRMNRIVVDPVMVSTGGDPLIDEEAIVTLKEQLLPIALIITPNLHEAEVLVGRRILTESDLEDAAVALHDLGPDSIIIKGGHSSDEGSSTDLFFDGQTIHRLRAPRLKSQNTHGGGCTFAAAIAAGLAMGINLDNSVRRAKEFVTKAIEHSYPLGHGSGPLNHFYRFWEK